MGPNFEIKWGQWELTFPAFDGTRFQVLELPERPVLPKPLRSRADMENNDPAAISALIRQSLQSGAR